LTAVSHVDCLESGGYVRSFIYNGKYTSADRCRYFDNARGSTLECAACLDVLVAKSLIDQAAAMKGKKMLIEIVSMLVGLIRSNSPNRDV